MKPETTSDNTETTPGRNYDGVKITAPPSRLNPNQIAYRQRYSGKTGQAYSQTELTNDQRARILTGSALFGVIAIVILHEFGHWLAGFVVTGRAPDFLVVAVRQKVTEFSAFGGILTWGAGPVLHLAVLWAVVTFASTKGERYPRVLTAVGAGALFTLAVHIFSWVGATFTEPDSWGNDLPKVATFAGSTARIWMHLLSALFLGATVLLVRRWWVATQATGRPGFYLSPAIVGAFQGGVLVIIASLFVAFSQ